MVSRLAAASPKCKGMKTTPGVVLMVMRGAQHDRAAPGGDPHRLLIDQPQAGGVVRVDLHQALRGRGRRAGNGGSCEPPCQCSSTRPVVRMKG